MSLLVHVPYAFVMIHILCLPALIHNVYVFVMIIDLWLSIKMYGLCLMAQISVPWPWVTVFLKTNLQSSLRDFSLTERVRNSSITPPPLPPPLSVGSIPLPPPPSFPLPQSSSPLPLYTTPHPPWWMRGRGGGRQSRKVVGIKNTSNWPTTD